VEVDRVFVISMQEESQKSKPTSMADIYEQYETNER
jgi:hypothetical protein